MRRAQSSGGAWDRRGGCRERGAHRRAPGRRQAALQQRGVRSQQQRGVVIANGAGLCEHAAQVAGQRVDAAVARPGARGAAGFGQLGGVVHE